MLTLFISPGSCSRASHIALEESGLAFQTRRLNFAAQEQQSEAFLKINPKGRVPALETDRGTLTETPAILGYIALMAPDARLAPLDDAFALAKLQSFNAYLSSTVHVAHAHGRRASRWADDEAAIEAMKLKVAENMTECFKLIENTLLEGPWVMGEHYSIADPYLFTLSCWLESDGVSIADFPRVAAHYNAMLQRPAVERALAGEKA